MINWPVPSYIGETYTSPNGNTWAWNGYGWDTLGGATVEGDLLYIEVQPDPEDIRALPGQSFELIPAPGPGKYLDIVKIICESNADVSPSTSAYNYVSASVLYFSYESSGNNRTGNYIGGVVLNVKGELKSGSTYLWMGDTDSFAIVFPYSNQAIASIFSTNRGLYVGIDDADNDANNATVGNHLVTFKIFYRIKDLTI